MSTVFLRSQAETPLVNVDRNAFQQQVLKTITFESMQMDKKDWDRIVSLK